MCKCSSCTTSIFVANSALSISVAPSATTQAPKICPLSLDEISLTKPSVFPPLMPLGLFVVAFSLQCTVPLLALLVNQM